jgi:hypothetical protein
MRDGCFGNRRAPRTPIRRVGRSVQEQPGNSEINFSTYKIQFGGRTSGTNREQMEGSALRRHGVLRGPTAPPGPWCYHGRIARVGDRFRLVHGQWNCV